MKSLVTKIMSVILAVAIFTAVLPGEAFAASGDSVTYLEVTVNNAPVRSSKDGTVKNVVTRVSKGEVIKCTGSSLNWKLNRWYHVKGDGWSGYIYSGNVKTHKHKYIDSVSYEGATYKVCKCGYISVTYLGEKVNYTKYGMGSIPMVSLTPEMLAYAGTAGTVSVADGLLPVGDMIAIGILVVGCIYTARNAVPTALELEEITVDLSDYINRNRGVCSDTQFRTVRRENGLLRYTSDACLNAAEAYVIVRYTGQDIYTRYEVTAWSLATIHGGGFSERDKNKDDYYYHYHLLANNKAEALNGKRKDNKAVVGGHIFYGTTGTGLTPS